MLIIWGGAALAAPGDMVEDDAEIVWWVQETGGSFGWVTQPMADIDGDGIGEVITSAPYSIAGGRVSVLSGVDGSEILRMDSTSPGAQLGYSVSDAGDVDGDGVSDVLAGAPNRTSGRLWVFSGVDGHVIHEVAGVADGDALGEAVSLVDDVDGDGFADVAAGGRGHADGAGRVVLISGADGGLLREWVGQPSDALGTGLAPIEDLDGDGIADLIVGAADAGAEGRGAVWVYSTGTGQPLLGPLEPGPMGWDLGLWFVGSVGDIDDDAIPDVFAGDFAANGGSGLALVFSGADGRELLRFTGEGGEGLGCGRGAGDIDADGVPDLAIGSWQHNGGSAAGGRVTVYSGVDGAPLHQWTSLEAGENLGFDAVGFEDVDGDGGLDLIASGATLNNVYVLRGPVPATDEAPPPTDPGGGCGCAAGGPAEASIALCLVLALTAPRRGGPRRPPGTDR